MIYKSSDAKGKEFASKVDMFRYLQANKALIVARKCATKIHSEYKGYTELSGETIKSNDSIKAGEVHAIINTTDYMDSHNDVHRKGIWNKSVKEQQGKVFYIHDHQLEAGKILAMPNDIEMFVEERKWSDIGVNSKGTTEALTFKIKKFDDEAPKQAMAMIQSKMDLENSIRMQYIESKVSLAVDSDADEFKAEKAAFDTLIDGIANKDEVKEQGYFWDIAEAKIIKEGSMVVAGGSNPATPIEHAPDNAEPSKMDTQISSETAKPTRRKRIFY